jgi:GTPase SAR1 family protein
VIKPGDYVNPLDNWTNKAKLIDLAELRAKRGVCLVLSGPPAVGKTTLAGTIIHSELAVPCMYLDVESGSHVLPDPPMIDIGNGNTMPALYPVEIKTFQQAETAITQLNTNPKPFKSAVLDNFSELLSLCMKKHNYSNLADKERFSAWNKITDDMLDITRTCRDLARDKGFIMIIILWDTTDNLDDPTSNTKKTIQDFQLTPKLAEKFKGLLDTAGYVVRPPSGKQYPPILRFDSSPVSLGDRTYYSIPTKLRLSPSQEAFTTLPKVIYNPDLGELIDYVMGGKPWDKAKHDKP